MRRTKGLGFIGLVAVSTVAWWLVNGCDKKPTDPPPEPEPPKDYIVYGHDWLADSIFYAYHVLTGQLDTIAIPGQRVYDLDVSADGNRLYIRYLNFVRVVDTDDFSTIIELPYRSSWGVSVSPDNRYIALHGGGFRILETQDYSVVFLDTVGSYDGVFSANGSRYYGVSLSTECAEVQIVDLERDFNVGRVCLPDDYRFYSLIPSPDERYLYMFRSLGDCYAFLDVYDLEGDSLMSRKGVAPACGDMAITPDGRSLFFTGPGDMHGWPPATYTFAHYDVATQSVDSALYFSHCAGLYAGMIGSDLVITPDGQFVATSSSSGSRLIIYDVMLGDTTAIKCIGGCGPVGLTVQNGR